MINFRFHLISIVAIFLALGIGIVMGSTVIDRAIVDSLKNRIDAAEKNTIERKIENERLNNILEGQNKQNTVLAGHAVASQLVDQTVFVFSIGNVPESTIVETRELLAVSGARLGSETIFNSDFLKSNKTKLAKELHAIESVKALQGSEKNINTQIAMTLTEILNIKAGGINENAIPVDVVNKIFSKYKVFSEQENAVTFDAFQPVSFLVLVNRSELADEKANEFVTRLNTKYPTTIGLNGNETDVPSRTKAIESFSDQLQYFSIVDNVESPSGRATLLISHLGTIKGVREIYGVSKEATSPAPELDLL